MNHEECFLRNPDPSTRDERLRLRLAFADLRARLRRRGTNCDWGAPVHRAHSVDCTYRADCSEPILTSLVSQLFESPSTSTTTTSTLGIPPQSLTTPSPFCNKHTGCRNWRGEGFFQPPPTLRTLSTVRICASKPTGRTRFEVRSSEAERAKREHDKFHGAKHGAGD